MKKNSNIEKINGTKEKPKKEEDRKRKIIIVIIIFLLVLICFNVGEVLNKIPTRPVIKSKSNEWGIKNTVKVEKDSKSKNGIKYYLYCVNQNKNEKECIWKKTYTKNVIITGNGTYYVFFKGVSNDGSISKTSAYEEVKIDGSIPEILDSKLTSTFNEIEAKVVAKDSGSGIDKYYFKLDDGKWIESYLDNYTFTGLKEDTIYKVTIKVVDKVGNEKEINLSIKTKKKEDYTTNNNKLSDT